MVQPGAALVTLLYAAAGVTWILLSEMLVYAPTEDPLLQARLEVAKGLGFAGSARVRPCVWEARVEARGSGLAFREARGSGLAFCPPPSLSPAIAALCAVPYRPLACSRENLAARGFAAMPE